MLSLHQCVTSVDIQSSRRICDQGKVVTPYLCLVQLDHLPRAVDSKASQGKRWYEGTRPRGLTEVERRIEGCEKVRN